MNNSNAAQLMENKTRHSLAINIPMAVPSFSSSSSVVPPSSSSAPHTNILLPLTTTTTSLTKQSLDAHRRSTSLNRNDQKNNKSGGGGNENNARGGLESTWSPLLQSMHGSPNRPQEGDLRGDYESPQTSGTENESDDSDIDQRIDRYAESTPQKLKRKAVLPLPTSSPHKKSRLMMQNQGQQEKVNSSSSSSSSSFGSNSQNGKSRSIIDIANEEEEKEDDNLREERMQEKIRNLQEQIHISEAKTIYNKKQQKEEKANIIRSSPEILEWCELHNEIEVLTERLRQKQNEKMALTPHIKRLVSLFPLERNNHRHGGANVNTNASKESLFGTRDTVNEATLGELDLSSLSKAELEKIGGKGFLRVSQCELPNTLTRAMWQLSIERGIGIRFKVSLVEAQFWVAKWINDMKEDNKRITTKLTREYTDKKSITRLGGTIENDAKFQVKWIFRNGRRIKIVVPFSSSLSSSSLPSTSSSSSSTQSLSTLSAGNNIINNSSTRENKLVNNKGQDSPLSLSTEDIPKRRLLFGGDKNNQLHNDSYADRAARKGGREMQIFTSETSDPFKASTKKTQSTKPTKPLTPQNDSLIQSNSQRRIPTLSTPPSSEKNSILDRIFRSSSPSFSSASSAFSFPTTTADSKYNPLSTVYESFTEENERAIDRKTQPAVPFIDIDSPPASSSPRNSSTPNDDNLLSNSALVDGQNGQNQVSSSSNVDSKTPSSFSPNSSLGVLPHQPTTPLRLQIGHSVITVGNNDSRTSTPSSRDSVTDVPNPLDEMGISSKQQDL
jgi:hypothetical protein